MIDQQQELDKTGFRTFREIEQYTRLLRQRQTKHGQTRHDTPPTF